MAISIKGLLCGLPLMKSGGDYWVKALIFLTIFCTYSCFLLADERIVPGSTSGQLNISPDGSTAYSIPIHVSPGTAGVEPKLALAYNSRGGASAVGFGWAISGLSSIQRGSRNKYEDGMVRGVNLDDQDALYLDGEKLIQIESASSEFREFRSRIDNYSRIRAYNWGAKGPQKLIVETRAGLKLYFGSDESSRIKLDATGAVLTWLCDRIEDSVGNFMQFNYFIDDIDYRIKEIIYTGNEAAKLEPYANVEFIYKEVSPYSLRYFHGQKIEQKYLLDRIKTSFNQNILREYVPKYNKIDNFRKSYHLVELIESGSNGLHYHPLKFLYSGAKGGWKEHVVNYPAELMPFSGGRGIVFSNVEGNTGQELLYRFLVGGELKTGTYSFSTGSPKLLDSSKWAPPVDLTVEDYLLKDLNGDGYDDFFAAGAASFLSHNTNGWDSISNAGLSFNLAVTGKKDAHHLFINVDSGSEETLVWSSPDQKIPSGANTLTNKQWINRPEFSPPHLFQVDESNRLNGVYALDVDCDGRQELVYNLRSPNGTVIQEIYKSSTKGWEEFKNNKFSLNFSPVPHSAAIRITELNADGCQDIVVAYRLNDVVVQKVYTSSKNGWNEDHRGFPNVIFWDGNENTEGKLIAELSDISGDGQPDLFWNTNAESTLGRGAYKLTPTSWEPANDLAPPNQLPDLPMERARKFAVLQITGSPTQQLAYIQDQGLPNFYTHKSGSWALDNKFDIPVTIAQFDKADLGVRFPDLNGDGYADIAYTKKAGKTITKIAHVFKPGKKDPWREDARYKIPVATFSEDLKDTGVFLVDFNGDGITDILHAYQPAGSSNPVREAYVNCSLMPECQNISPDKEGGYWKNVTEDPRFIGYVPPIPFTQEGVGSLGVRALDINGDGLTDLVVSREEDDPTGITGPKLVQRIFLNQLDIGSRIGKWVETNESPLPPVAFVRPLRAKADPSIGFAHNRFPYPISLISDDEWEQDNPLSKVRDNRVELVDIDGDRLPDVIYKFGTWIEKDESPEEREQRIADKRPVELVWKIIEGAFLNRESKWIPASGYQPKHRLDSDETKFAEQAKSSTQISFQDINNDGLTDLIHAERCDNPCSPGRPKAINETYLNNGIGWEHATSYDIPGDALVKNTRGDQGHRLLDINADGLADILYHRVVQSDAVEKGAYINTGMGWAQTNEADGYAPPIPFVQAGKGDLGVRPLDLNGDGIVDLVQTFKRSESDNVNRVWINEPFLSPHNHPYKTDLLTEVVDGLGRSSKLQYRSFIGTVFTKSNVQSALANSNIRDPIYPVLDPPMPGYVVTSLEVSGLGVQKRTSSYRYDNYRINTLTGKALGFGTQEITDVERERITNVTYSQEDGLVGNILTTRVRQKVSNNDQVLISESLSDFAVSATHGQALQNGFRPLILQAHIKRMYSKSKDLDEILLSSQTDSFTYDNNGNPTSIYTTFADDSGSETINKYADNIEKWHLGRLSESSVTLFSPGKQSQTRRASFKYDENTGQLVQEVSLVGTPFETKIDYYPRDKFGNKVISTISVNTGESSRSTTVEFDPLGRFPNKTKNQLNHTSTAIFDDISGRVTSVCDANNLCRNFEYDSLQRISSETDTNNASKKTKTKFVLHSTASFAVTEQVGALPPTITLHDAAGRPRQHTSVGINGKLVTVDYEYDRLGRSVRSSIPRFNGEAPVYTTRRYDSLDRIIEEQQPDNAITVTQYEGLRTIKTDPLKRQIIIEKDLRGRVWQITDSLKGKTTFNFDVAGKATDITNALGHVSSAEYNIAGSRVALNDPTLGYWTYSYNGFSELIEQVDARKESVKLEYDSIGRLIERQSRTDKSTYQFDQGENSIGKLIRVISSQGGSRTIGYDKFGRVTRVDINAGRDYSRVEQFYDELSRPSFRRYSSGLLVANQYDNNGFWREVQTNSGNSNDTTLKTIWQAEDIDALGRVTQERLGNGVINKQLYDTKTGQMIVAEAKTASGDIIQDFTLEYDLVGNLVKRIDIAKNNIELFTYDELNRLTSTSLNSSENVDINYDPLGNILQKTGTGHYQYCDSDKTKTLCGIKSLDGTISSFKYDGAGNIVQLGDKELSYDGEGRVVSIANGRKYKSSFRYGADGELIYQQSRAGQTKFDVTYLGDTEILREAFTPPLTPTPERTRVRHFISSSTGSLGFFEYTYWHFPFRQSAPMYGMLVMDNPLRSSEISSAITYFIKDQLGSLRATLDESGKVTDHFDYDAWGKRRQDKAHTYHSVRQGFTGHQHLDNLDLIHMGGRVYSPSLARFVSPDPFVQSPGYSQSHNRYAYVLNNPLGFIDPSGYFFDKVFREVGNAFSSVGNAFNSIVDAVVGKPLKWIGEQLHKAGQWLGQNWRTVAVIAATVALGPAGGYLGAFLIGAAIGGGSVLLYGGSFEQALNGALIGGVTGAAFYGVGSLGIANEYGSALAHGAAGGVGSYIQNRDFATGFLAGTFSKYSGKWMNHADTNAVSRIATAAMIGGITSEIGGGNFENGATTFAFLRTIREIPEFYKSTVGYDLDLNPGGEAAQKTEMSPPVRGANNIGIQGGPVNAPDLFSEGGSISKTLNTLPGFNATAGMHDVFQTSMGNSTWRDILNVPGMPVAATITYSGFIGQHINNAPPGTIVPIRVKTQNQNGNLYIPLNSF